MVLLVVQVWSGCSAAASRSQCVTTLRGMGRRLVMVRMLLIEEDGNVRQTAGVLQLTLLYTTYQPHPCIKSEVCITIS